MLDSPEDMLRQRNNKFNDIDKISEDEAEYEDDESIGSGLNRRRKSKKPTVTGFRRLQKESLRATEDGTIDDE